MIGKKRISSLLTKALNAKAKMDAAMSLIALDLQPHFEAEISIEFQAGDGFVLVWERHGFDSAPANFPVSKAIQMIEKDPNVVFSVEQAGI